MDRRIFIASAGAAAASPLIAQEGSLRSRLLGFWALQEAVSITGDKTSPWFGRREPIAGLLIYHDSGWMSVQISGARPDNIGRDAFTSMPDLEKYDLLKEYYAYYGTFELDEPSRVVTHHVQDSVLPYERKAALKRTISLEGHTLTILTAPRVENGTSSFNRLVWIKRA